MLILASASPRRHALLSLLGIEFHVLTSDIDESVLPGETPQDYVLRLAVSKSLASNPLSAERLVVIAADTAVVDDGQILGKPVHPREAATMLENLRGRNHQVLSGIAVRDTQTDEIFTDLCTTRVAMRNYADDEIDMYITSGDPMDKAGAYAIQHPVFNPVAHISGCYANVVGLPLCHLGQILKRLGVNFREEIIQECRLNGEYQCRLVDRINSMHSENR
jgi:MAF protein